MSDFQELKIWLTQVMGLPKDALHIYVGMAVFLLVAIVLRRPLRSLVPIGAVLAAALAGEVWDSYDTWDAGQRLRWDRSWHDIWNTCFWPFVLFLLARYTNLLRR